MISGKVKRTARRVRLLFLERRQAADVVPEVSALGFGEHDDLLGQRRWLLTQQQVIIRTSHR